MLVEEFASQLEKADILVYNAASNPFFGSIKDIPDEVEKIMNNKHQKVTNCGQMVIPEMMERKDGSIIIVSSIGGLNASLL